jgi:hypothetical protein
MSLLALGVTCQIALGREPNDANEPLRFETSSTRLDLPKPLQDKPQDRKPTYAVGIAPEGSADFFAWPKSYRVRAFRDIALADKDLSLQQKEFVEDTNGLLDFAERSFTVLYPEDDPNHPQALLYAMSLPDAKRMAQLYVQFARSQYKETLDETQGFASRRSENIGDAEKRIPDLEKRLETARKSLEEIKSNIPYRSDQEASEAIGELDRMLSTTQIEMAGIRARIEVIQGYQREKQQAEGVASKLELMFIEEAVAMRGAEAKNRMAMQLRGRASRFIDLSQSLRTMEKEKNDLTERLDSWREDLPRVRERLATIREGEPKVRDNKVFIYPVGQEPPRPRAYRSTQP